MRCPPGLFLNRKGDPKTFVMASRRIGESGEPRRGPPLRKDAGGDYDPSQAEIQKMGPKLHERNKNECVNVLTNKLDRGLFLFFRLKRCTRPLSARSICNSLQEGDRSPSVRIALQPWLRAWQRDSVRCIPRPLCARAILAGGQVPCRCALTHPRARQACERGE
jgi:hypothetical protein